VADDGEEVDGEVVDVDVDGDLADGLGGVGVEQDAVPASDPGQLADRLDGAGLVVGVHDRRQHRRRCDGGLERLGVDEAMAIDGKGGDPEAVEPVQAVADGEQRRVLGLLGDDVVTAIPSRQGGAGHGEGVALGPSAGEDDLCGRGADQLCDL
jgi:hypothetical protein